MNVTHTGYIGAYCFPCHQMRIEGLPVADLSDIRLGASWKWDGPATRVDGPDSVLRLGSAIGEQEFRHRVVQSLLRRKRVPSQTTIREKVEVQPALDNNGFVVTNGAQQFRASVVFDQSDCRTPLVVFSEGLPPRGQELWVIETAGLTAPRAQAPERVMICFTQGTHIDTPQGPREVSDLRPGDLVMTQDNGAQPLIWTGQRRVSGVRLQAMPWMRPVLIRAGALERGRPSDDLLVSPDHRLLIARPSAQALFGQRDVLAKAGHLIDDKGIARMCPPEGVTYVHLMLARHAILLANGVACESFHPDDANPDMLDPVDAARLKTALPDFDFAAGYARRTVSRPEAALLMFAA